MGQRPAEALQTRSSALLNRLVEHNTAVVGTPARAVSGNGICGSTTFSTPFQTCAQVVQTRGGSCRHIASGGNSGEVPVVAAAAYHGDQRHRHTGEAHECEHRCGNREAGHGLLSTRRMPTASQHGARDRARVHGLDVQHGAKRRGITQQTGPGDGVKPNSAGSNSSSGGRLL